MLKNKKAFTIVETMVAIFIFLIICSGMFLVLGIGRNTWFDTDAYIDIRQELRQSKEQMEKELTECRAGSAVITNNTTLDFQIPTAVSEAGDITWQQIRYFIGGLNNAQLTRLAGGNVKVIANNIDINNSSFAFDPNNGRILLVTLVAARQSMQRRTINLTMTFSVMMRN